MKTVGDLYRDFCTALVTTFITAICCAWVASTANDHWPDTLQLKQWAPPAPNYHKDCDYSVVPVVDKLLVCPRFGFCSTYVTWFEGSGREKPLVHPANQQYCISMTNNSMFLNNTRYVPSSAFNLIP